MTATEQAIAAVLVYYDLADRPLTAVEIFKALPPLGGVSFFEFTKIINGSACLKRISRSKNGLYFLNGRDCLLRIREKRIKIAQIKWRLLKKRVKFLRLVPFLRLVAVNGSLAVHNTGPSSDFDLLIITAPNRIWLARALTTAIAGILGVRRHGKHIKDRLCLNCYIDGQNLVVESATRLYPFQSAQEYNCLTPVIESDEGLYKKFLSENGWLKNHLNSFPWPNEATAKKIRSSRLFSAARKIAEYPFSAAFGNRIEDILGRRQLKRISRKIKQEPSNGCFIDKNCLMFHPRPKSLNLKRAFDEKMLAAIKSGAGSSCGKLS